MFGILIISTFTIGALAYIPDGKDAFMSGMFLRELVTRMGNGQDLSSDLAYMDFPQENRLSLGSRSLGGRDLEMEEEPLFPLMDYDSLEGRGNPIHPSIRDQEFLEHSSLYGSQFVSGGAGEGQQRLHPQGSLKNVQEVKSDSTLPAYCNPPNPCPVGYTAEQGCIEEFENTALYSRRYQGSQDCMCDTEHMFDCPSPRASMDEDDMDSFNELDFNRFLQHTMQNEGALNPFLTGERLPVAAKKGHNVVD